MSIRPIMISYFNYTDTANQPTPAKRHTSPITRDPVEFTGLLSDFGGIFKQIGRDLKQVGKVFVEETLDSNYKFNLNELGLVIKDGENITAAQNVLLGIEYDGFVPPQELIQKMVEIAEGPDTNMCKTEMQQALDDLQEWGRIDKEYKIINIKR